MKKQLLLLTLIFSLTKINAQWSTNSAVNNSVCVFAGQQQNVSSISDGAGGSIITWQDNRSGLGFDIYAQRISANGTVLWATNGIAICTATNSQQNPKITSDGANGAIITWQDYRSGFDFDVYAQRVNASGVTLWASGGNTVCVANNWQGELDIISDGLSGAIVTWTDDRGSTLDIYAQRINSSGNTQWTVNGVAICTAFFMQELPQIVSNGSGGAIITWEDQRGGGAGTEDIYAQQINSAGTTLWTSNGVLICGATNGQWNPQLIFNPGNGAIITWYDYRGTDRDIYAQLINTSGVTQWTANGVIICSAVNEQFKPQIATDGLNGAIITWEDFRSGILNCNIYAQRVNASGVIQWPVNGVIVCNAANDQRDPIIIPSGIASAIIAWEDERSGSGVKDVYAQLVNSIGNTMWTANGEAISTAAFNQINISMISDGSNGAILAWDDYRTNVEYNIYAQNICQSGYIGQTIPAAPATITGTTTICSGSTKTYSVAPLAGALFYNWTLPSGWSGFSNTNVISLTAGTATGTLSVIAVNSCGNSLASAQTITVIISPTVSVNSGTICSGNSFTITPSGANTYTIQGGSSVVSPLSNNSYTVKGTATNGCVSVNTATSNVTVNTTPTVSVNSGSICSGNSFTIIPSGTNTYTIQGGSAVVSPTATASYTVVGTGTNGCVSPIAATSNVTVNTLPNVITNTSNTLVCSGTPVNLSAMGATTYTWNTGSNLTTISVSPTTTTTYTLMGTDANGCIGSTTITQNVSTCTGINSQMVNSNSQIVLYPNPSNGILNVELENLNENTKIEITTSLGEIILTENLSIQHSSFNIHHFSNGVYFVKVISGNDQTTKRLVISK